MTRTLMKIQDEDADRLATGEDVPNFSLAGTGKTLSTLEAFIRAGHKRGLVLAPSIALTMWEQEIKDWVGASVKVCRSGAQLPDNSDFIVTTYDLAGGNLRMPLYKNFSSNDQQALIMDEHHALRRGEAKRTIGVYGVTGDGAGGHLENFDQAWSLTGTPIMRHQDDLFPLLRGLHPEVLKRYSALDYDKFLRTFCVCKVKQYHENMPPKLAVIRSQNEAIMKKLLYKDIGAIRHLTAPDLPELVEAELYPAMQRIPSEYAKMVNKMTEAELLAALVAPEETEFSLQSVWQAVTLAKVKSACDYLEDLVLTSPVLVGVWHNSVGFAYLEELTKRGIIAERVYGATPPGKREHIRDRFNSGATQVVIGQMQSMGVSWNLQERSNRVIIAQDHYSPGVIEQFYKRVYRTGQKNKTYVDTLMSRHPLDQVIKRMRIDRGRSQAKTLDN